MLGANLGPLLYGDNRVFRSLKKRIRLAISEKTTNHERRTPAYLLKSLD